MRTTTRRSPACSAIPNCASTARGLWRAALASPPALASAQVQAVYLRDSYAELGVNTPRRPAFRNPHL
jgi:hypothetical protein